MNQKHLKQASDLVKDLKLNIERQANLETAQTLEVGFGPSRISLTKGDPEMASIVNQMRLHFINKQAAMHRRAKQIGLVLN